MAHGQVILERGEEVWNWSSPAGKLRLAKRVRLFVRSLGLERERKRVLELGCGTGLYTEQLAPFCAELVATDISEHLLAEAGRRPGNQAVRFVRQNLEAIEPESTGRDFRGVFGCSVLHHLDLEETLPRLRAVMAPGAELAFSEPNLLNPQVRLIFSRFAWARRAWATSDSEMAFYPWELRSIFRRHGFEVVECFPFDFMHPAIPAALLSPARWADSLVEQLPLLRLFGGSCFIHARAPS